MASSNLLHNLVIFEGDIQRRIATVYTPDFYTDNETNNATIELSHVAISEMDRVFELAKALPLLVDIDKCPDDFLPSLGALLGYKWVGSKPHRENREEIKKLVHVYSSRGIETSVTRIVLGAGASTAELFTPYDHLAFLDSGRKLDDDLYLEDSTYWRWGTYEIRGDIDFSLFRESIADVHPAGTTWFGKQISVDTSDESEDINESDVYIQHVIEDDIRDTGLSVVEEFYITRASARWKLAEAAELNPATIATGATYGYAKYNTSKYGLTLLGRAAIDTSIDGGSIGLYNSEYEILTNANGRQTEFGAYSLNSQSLIPKTLEIRTLNSILVDDGTGAIKSLNSVVYAVIGTGTGSVTVYSAKLNKLVVPDSVRLYAIDSNDNTLLLYDDNEGSLIDTHGNNSGSVDYTSGVLTARFSTSVGNGEKVYVSYSYLSSESYGSVDYANADLSKLSFPIAPASIKTSLPVQTSSIADISNGDSTIPPPSLRISGSIAGCVTTDESGRITACTNLGWGAVTVTGNGSNGNLPVYDPFNGVNEEPWLLALSKNGSSVRGAKPFRLNALGEPNQWKIPKYLGFNGANSLSLVTAHSISSAHTMSFVVRFNRKDKKRVFLGSNDATSSMAGYDGTTNSLFYTVLFNGSVRTASVSVGTIIKSLYEDNCDDWSIVTITRGVIATNPITNSLSYSTTASGPSFVSLVYSQLIPGSVSITAAGVILKDNGRGLFINPAGEVAGNIDYSTGITSGIVWPIYVPVGTAIYVTLRGLSSNNTVDFFINGSKVGNTQTLSTGNYWTDYFNVKNIGSYASAAPTYYNKLLADGDGTKSPPLSRTGSASLVDQTLATMGASANNITPALTFSNANDIDLVPGSLVINTTRSGGGTLTMADTQGTGFLSGSPDGIKNTVKWTETGAVFTATIQHNVGTGTNTTAPSLTTLYGPIIGHNTWKTVVIEAGVQALYAKTDGTIYRSDLTTQAGAINVSTGDVTTSPTWASLVPTDTPITAKYTASGRLNFPDMVAANADIKATYSYYDRTFVGLDADSDTINAGSLLLRTLPYDEATANKPDLISSATPSSLSRWQYAYDTTTSGTLAGNVTAGSIAVTSPAKFTNLPVWNFEVPKGAAVWASWNSGGSDFNGFDGAIADIVVYPFPLTNSQRIEVEKSLASQYDIPLNLQSWHSADALSGPYTSTEQELSVSNIVSTGNSLTCQLTNLIGNETTILDGYTKSSVVHGTLSLIIPLSDGSTIKLFDIGYPNISRSDTRQTSNGVLANTFRQLYYFNSASKVAFTTSAAQVDEFPVDTVPVITSTPIGLPNTGYYPNTGLIKITLPNSRQIASGVNIVADYILDTWLADGATFNSNFSWKDSGPGRSHILPLAPQVLSTPAPSKLVFSAANFSLETTNPQQTKAYITGSLPTGWSPYGKVNAIRLTENGKKLGPGHCLHADIRVNGLGRHNVSSYNALRMSTSDNSSPITNGRVYAIEVSNNQPTYELNKFSSKTNEKESFNVGNGITKSFDIILATANIVNGSVTIRANTARIADPVVTPNKLIDYQTRNVKKENASLLVTTGSNKVTITDFKLDLAPSSTVKDISINVWASPRPLIYNYQPSTNSFTVDGGYIGYTAACNFSTAKLTFSIPPNQPHGTLVTISYTADAVAWEAKLINETQDYYLSHTWSNVTGETRPSRVLARLKGSSLGTKQPTTIGNPRGNITYRPGNEVTQESKLGAFEFTIPKPPPTVDYFRLYMSTNKGLGHEYIESPKVQSLQILGIAGTKLNNIALPEGMAILPATGTATRDGIAISVCKAPIGTLSTISTSTSHLLETLYDDGEGRLRGIAAVGVAGTLTNSYINYKTGEISCAFAAAVTSSMLVFAHDASAIALSPSTIAGWKATRYFSPKITGSQKAVGYKPASFNNDFRFAISEVPTLTTIKQPHVNTSGDDIVLTDGTGTDKGKLYYYDGTVFVPAGEIDHHEGRIRPVFPHSPVAELPLHVYYEVVKPAAYGTTPSNEAYTGQNISTSGFPSLEFGGAEVMSTASSYTLDTTHTIFIVMRPDRLPVAAASGALGPYNPSNVYPTSSNTRYKILGSSAGINSISYVAGNGDGTNNFNADFLIYSAGAATDDTDKVVSAALPTHKREEWHVYTINRNGAVTTMGIDGEPLTIIENSVEAADTFVMQRFGSSYPPIVTNSPDNVDSITNNITPTNLLTPFIGKIAEILTFNSSLSVQDQKKTETYLMAKFGIAQSPIEVFYNDYVSRGIKGPTIKKANTSVQLVASKNGATIGFSSQYPNIRPVDTAYCVEMWVKSNHSIGSTQSVNGGTLYGIDWTNNSGDKNSLLFGMASGSGNLSIYVKAQYPVSVNTTATSTFSLVGTTSIADGMWHHVAFKLDPTTSKAETIIDGTLDAVSYNYPNYNLTNINEDFESNFYIGARDLPSTTIIKLISSGSKTVNHTTTKLPIDKRTVKITAKITPAAIGGVSFQEYETTLEDDGLGVLIGHGHGTVDYVSGVISAVFAENIPPGRRITISHKYSPVSSDFIDANIANVVVYKALNIPTTEELRHTYDISLGNIMTTRQSNTFIYSIKTNLANNTGQYGFTIGESSLGGEDILGADKMSYIANDGMINSKLPVYTSGVTGGWYKKNP